MKNKTGECWYHSPVVKMSIPDSFKFIRVLTTSRYKFMKKNYCKHSPVEEIHRWSKILRVMRLTLIFIFCSVFTLYAENTLSQTARVTIHKTDVPLQEILNEIEAQTEYLFFYNKKNVDVDSKVSVKAVNQAVARVLNTVLKDSDVSYEMVGNHIILSDRFTDIKNNTESITQQFKRTITGNVVDENGEPIIGASVMEMNTPNGTITDMNGKFSMEVAEGAILKITFIGYKTVEIPTDSRNNFNIQLSEDTKILEEVVVVGYGTRKKETLTGSVVAVSGKDIAQSPAADVSASMAGRLPGLIVNARAGDPGAPDTQFFVRGRGTIGDNSALVIIDGVERGDIGKLNPNDIESITVLKDSEASIYGSRGANGVIIVTTKSGTKGKPVVNFSYNQSFQQPTRLPKMADSYTFASVANEMAILRNEPQPYSSDDLNKFRQGTEPGYGSTNWFRETARSWAPQHRTNVSVSGGNDRVDYYFSFGELMQKDHLKHSSTDYRQYNVRAKIDAYLNNGFTVGMNLAGMYDDRHVPWFSSTELASHLFLYHPMWTTYWDGTDNLRPLRGDQNWVNMVSDNTGWHDLINKKFQGTLYIKWQVPWVSGLTLDVSGSYDTSHKYWKTFRTPSYVYVSDGNNGYKRVKDGMSPEKAQLTDRSEMPSQTYFIAKVNYENSFGNHNIQAMAAYEQTTGNGWYLEASKTDFESISLPILNVGPSDKTKWGMQGRSSEWARQNYFGRVNYDYKGKYMAQGTFRFDGSSNFPKSDRFGFFPSFSAGWRISEESFLNSVEFLDNLKLRVSWGLTGNDRIADFQYMNTFEYAGGYVIGNKDVQGIQQQRIANPAITWEKANTWDFGFEAMLWKGRLSVEFDYFRSKREDMLVKRDRSIPDYKGLTLPDENIATMLNRGFELVVGHRNKVDEVQYSISGNFNFARNKILYIAEAPGAEDYQLQTGRPWGTQLYYKSIGIFRTQEELDSYPHLGGTSVGDLKFEDVNGDGVLDSRDRIRIDQTKIPEITFGLNATVSYKNFDLSLLFQGQHNSQFHMEGNETFFKYMDDKWGNFLQWRADGRWIPGADNTYAKQPKGGQNSVNTADRNTHFLYKGNFLRFKNAELGYTLPNTVTKKLKIESLRLSVSANNICFLYDGLKDLGYDGEATSFWHYSIPRTVNFGVNLTF